MAGGSPWRTYESPFSFAPTRFLSANGASACGVGPFENFRFGPSIDHAVNRVNPRLRSEWRGRTGVSPCLFREGIWHDGDFEEAAACGLFATDLDGMRLERFAVAIATPVAIASPLATHGPVPAIVAGTRHHARLACGDACPVGVRRCRS